MKQSPSFAGGGQGGEMGWRVFSFFLWSGRVLSPASAGLPHPAHWNHSLWTPPITGLRCSAQAQSLSRAPHPQPRFCKEPLLDLAGAALCLRCELPHNSNH